MWAILNKIKIENKLIANLVYFISSAALVILFAVLFFSFGGFDGIDLSSNYPFNNGFPKHFVFLAASISCLIGAILYFINDPCWDYNGFVGLLLNVACLVLRVVYLAIIVVIFLLFTSEGTDTLTSPTEANQLLIFATLSMLAVNYPLRELIREHVLIGDGLLPYEPIFSYVASFAIGALVFLSGLYFARWAIYALSVVLFIFGNILIFRDKLILEYLFPYSLGDGGKLPYVPSSYGSDDNKKYDKYTGSGTFTYGGYSGSYEFQNYSHKPKSILVIKFPLYKLQKEFGYGEGCGDDDVKKFVTSELGVSPYDVEIDTYWG